MLTGNADISPTWRLSQEVTVVRPEILMKVTIMPPLAIAPECTQASSNSRLTIIKYIEEKATLFSCGWPSKGPLGFGAGTGLGGLRVVGRGAFLVCSGLRQ